MKDTGEEYGEEYLEAKEKYISAASASKNAKQALDEMNALTNEYMVDREYRDWLS